MEIELIVFDLDGTLIDSKVDLANAVNATRKDLGLEGLADTVVFSYVGNGAPVLIRKALGDGYPEERYEKSLQFFLQYYREHMLDHTRLYPGTREALERMREAGLKMAVLTNKPVRFSRDLLRGLGVAEYFAVVYGGNSFETKKPHREGLDKIMAELGAPPERTLVVGDSAVDVRTARNAGALACGVTWGFQPETLAGEAPDFLVGNWEELTEKWTGER
jgi:phosphoglycolate phosphatase